MSRTSEDELDDNAHENTGSDMQMSDEGSDVDMDIDGEDNKRVEAEEEEEEDLAESEELSPPPSPPITHPRLKIKLKLPQVPSPDAPASVAASTPSGQLEEPSQPPSRRAISRDIDIESEDDDDDDDQAQSVAGGSTRPMTSRQAVLASVVDSSHVSLSIAPAESGRKKKQLTESELALRREETARKRKNLSEKKLEDEKAETINRLLKKQSKSKTKRSALASTEDRTPLPATPAIPASARDGSQVPEGEYSEPAEVIPVMYRWVSTTKPPLAVSKEGAEQGPGDDASAMRLTFSVPVTVLQTGEAVVQPVKPLNTVTPLCDVNGCQERRKYRLVKDWMKGACGMEHLKALEQQMDIV
ncbi:hypothetical protein BV22DRAFT_1107073 [Leucogyrophana mollusca]|uniref:Uncharacterized protein n=1 Tax=Leucogyrophana mollusca TaxID=85980 RepID=A0ACB8B7I3_9AGAM|nr:hypothetical protein BV22DRAFT_1107073 [Leucogyrophana mollusca]